MLKCLLCARSLTCAVSPHFTPLRASGGWFSRNGFAAEETEVQAHEVAGVSLLQQQCVAMSTFASQAPPPSADQPTEHRG